MMLSYRPVRTETPGTYLSRSREEQSFRSGPSCTSLRSDTSKGWITDFKTPQPLRRLREEQSFRSGPSCVSLRSDLSKGWIANFKHQPHREEESFRPGPSCVSLRSDLSKGWIANFNQHQPHRSSRGKQSFRSGPSCVSPKSDISEGCTTNFEQHQPLSPEPENEPDVFKLLEANFMSFVKKELQKFNTWLATDNTKVFQSENEGEEKSSKLCLEIILDFLRRMKQEELAERLQNCSYKGVCRSDLMDHIKQKLSCVSEGVFEENNPQSLNQFYTELHITEGESTGVNAEHEIVHIEMASKQRPSTETTISPDGIFKCSLNNAIPNDARPDPAPVRTVRTVITKGIAGIGKTVLTQKFSLDWAEGRSNQDIQLLFPFSFRKLNLLRDKNFSLMELVHHFFNVTTPLISFEDLRVVLIFDGLDEYRQPLDFNSKLLTKATESSSVQTLLVNLIRGTLLPSACIWITTRPAAATQIPAMYVSRVTEVRGFTDLQKEEYFTNRFREEQQAKEIISHMKKFRTLYIMCHIPIFCWIISEVQKTKSEDTLPQTLTEMYIHFLRVKMIIRKRKSDEAKDQGMIWSENTTRIVKSLGKLAFHQLQKGNLIFYESDLKECGLDSDKATEYSDVFTQVFREESCLHQVKVYCFIHLSVQEFLAALHVHHTYFKYGVNPFLESHTMDDLFGASIYHYAVDEALRCPNGRLDLFLRFLVGLSQPSNQKLLQGVINEQEINPDAIQETAQYIQYKMNKKLSAERIINLFHCLNELGAPSLVKQVQHAMNENCLSEYMSGAQWSAVAFLLLSSDTDLDLFDLKRYCATEKVLLSLLPVVKASNKAILSYCNLSSKSCRHLSETLQSRYTCVTNLDLSNNDLLDSGVKMLCEGLTSPLCKIETLKLSGCLISEEGGFSLASALKTASSHVRELDVSYNSLGPEAMTRLTKLSKDDLCFLNYLRLEPSGPKWMTSGIQKYVCSLSLDPNTANCFLTVHNQEVKQEEFSHEYPGHEHRFDYWPQILCSTALTGRCYWEVDWKGKEIIIAMSYRGTSHKGRSPDTIFGYNSESWSSIISKGHLEFHHGTEVHAGPVISNSRRMGVYLDFEAGFLSFYNISGCGLSHLHTFSSTFTEPLFPGFALWDGSSVCLLD